MDERPWVGFWECTARSNDRKETGIDMQKKERMANLEVLRCVAMMMVVVLHYLGKGGLLPDLTAPLSVQDMAAWLLEAFCIVAVNVYMMISGYFLCESSFKLSRLLTLWLQLWLVFLGVGGVGGGACPPHKF